MILVAGATGQLGGMIAQSLLSQGKTVRILVREGSDYQHLVDAGAQPVTGDLKDPATLAPACEGVETVITTANAAQRGGADTFVSVDLHGNRNLIDAAKAAGVQQFVFISALGAAPDSPNPLMAAKAQAEAHLKQSGMAYTILAPDIFMEVWIGMIVGLPLQTQQPVTLVSPATSRHSFVSVRDVAAFSVAAVGHPQALNQYLPIGGPDAVSWLDIVRMVEGVIGASLPVNLVQPGQPIPGLPPEVGHLMAATETYESPLDMTGLAQTFNVQLTSVSDVVRGMFGAAG